MWFFSDTHLYLRLKYYLGILASYLLYVAFTDDSGKTCTTKSISTFAHFNATTDTMIFIIKIIGLVGDEPTSRRKIYFPTIDLALV